MKTQDDIIRKLSGISLLSLSDVSDQLKHAPASSETMDLVRSLVVDSRVCLQDMGPKMRPASKTKESDDYQGVTQVAIALGYDGVVSSTRRTDCPPHALIPLVAALEDEVAKIGREAAERIGMDLGEFREAVEKILKAIATAEYEKISGELAPRGEGSRTDQTANLKLKLD